MVAALLQRLGFRLATHTPGFFYLSPETILNATPDVFALGFYDDRAILRRTPGRNPLVRAAIARRPSLQLPVRTLACGGWFTVYDLAGLRLTPATKGRP